MLVNMAIRSIRCTLPGYGETGAANQGTFLVWGNDKYINKLLNKLPLILHGTIRIDNGLFGLLGPAMA